MPQDPPARPRREPHTTIGASIPLVECRRLHPIAEAQQITLSKLVTDALKKTYPPDDATR